MEKITNFINKFGLSIIIIILLILLLKSCSQTNKIEKIDKTTSAMVKQINQNDSLTRIFILKEIKVEGLRSELRMIQATDRKIFDVNRQNEIEKEIKSLQK